MKFHEDFTYPSTPDKVFALISDPDFREKSAVDGGGTDVKVSVKAHGEGATVTVIRTQKVDLPDFIKKVAGDKITVKQVEEWGEPDANGGRKAKVAMTVVGQPAGLHGTATLKPDGKTTAFTVSGDAKVSVPFVGKKVEPLVARAISAVLRHEVKDGTERL